MSLLENRGIRRPRRRRNRFRALTGSALTALASIVALVPEHPALGLTRPVPVRVGYFPNVTHAPALVGIDQGIFADAAPGVRTVPFNAGPDLVTALLSGAVDVGYLGPAPAVNAFARSGGEAVRIVSGAASGGSYLVVRPGVGDAGDLRRKVVASPQLGNTQDIALRHWLADNGLETDPFGGGDVSVVPQDNAAILAAFTRGAVAGAWVPEPWATRLVEEAGGRVLVDERDLWAGGEYASTVVVVRTRFAEEHPGVLRRFLAAHETAVAVIGADPVGARDSVVRMIERVTGKPVPVDLVATALGHVTFTTDPLPRTVVETARRSVEVGFPLPRTDLDRLFLTPER